MGTGLRTGMSRYRGVCSVLGGLSRGKDLRRMVTREEKVMMLGARWREWIMRQVSRGISEVAFQDGGEIEDMLLECKSFE